MTKSFAYFSALSSLTIRSPYWNWLAKMSHCFLPVDNIFALKDTHTNSSGTSDWGGELDMGEHGTTGTRWSRDPTLPSTDNRITANWTLGVSLSLRFVSTLTDSIFPTRVTSCTAFLGIYVSSKNHPRLSEPAARGRIRERGGEREETYKGHKKREEQSNEEQKTYRESKERAEWDWMEWNRETAEQRMEVTWWRVGEKTWGIALHSLTPSLIRKYNFGGGLRWIKCRREWFYLWSQLWTQLPKTSPGCQRGIVWTRKASGLDLHNLI